MTVSFNAVPSDLRVPLFYAEMDNSQANSSSGDAMRTLLIGHALNGAEAGQLRLHAGLSEVTATYGAGSMLARMYRSFRAGNPFGEVWCMAIAEPAAGAAATGRITITGTALAAGTLVVYLAGQRVQVGVGLNDPASTVATALAAAINAADALPVTAAAEAAVVTLTARHKGVTGNDVSIVPNYRGVAGGEVLPNGITLAVTAMTGGTGTVDWLPALSGLGDEPFEFICHPFTDTASLDAWRDEMGDTAGRWSWLQQIYGHVYTARRGVFGEQVTFGRARNDQHVTIVDVEPMQPCPVWEHAAAFAGRTSVFIAADPARPTQTGELAGILPSPRGKRRGLSERQSLLFSGIATTYTEGDSVRIERAVTSYQRNAFGQADDSYLDSETLHQLAFGIRYMRSRITSKYSRHKLADDGTQFGAGQAMVTPKVIAGELIAAYADLVEMGVFENIDAFRKALIVERAKGSPNRVNVLLPPDLVNQLRVLAVLNQFRLQY